MLNNTINKVELNKMESEMQKVIFKKIYNFQKKSKVKAGDGFKIKVGKYPFYTSSNVLTKSLNEFLFDEESLIFGTGGLASIHYCNEKFAVSTDCFVTQPKDKKEVFTKYVYYFLSGNMHILENGFKGAGLKHISKDYLENIEIPLPPLQTQQKIAAILDKADESRQYNKQLIEKYEDLTQILFLDMFGDPFRNEKGWEVKNLKSGIIKLQSGLSLSGEERQIKDEEIAVLKISAITTGVFINTEYKVVDKNEINKVLIHPKKGDLLFSRANTKEKVGAVAIVDKDYHNLFIPDKLWRIDTNHTLNKTFLKFLLSHSGFRHNIEKEATGTSGSMVNISMPKLLKIEAPLPPINLQNLFAERVQAIELQKQQAQEALQKSEQLFQSLLQLAFKGELN
ncbi:restriction endonuclease subunit S [Flavobacterium sp. PL12]|uniref:restriction endonuclease subunit S n=1 Tax=Flavobacterium sp. PL12 TaxID=3071718 RepID=UPI00319E011A